MGVSTDARRPASRSKCCTKQLVDYRPARAANMARVLKTRPRIRRERDPFRTRADIVQANGQIASRHREWKRSFDRL